MQKDNKIEEIIQYKVNYKNLEFSDSQYIFNDIESAKRASINDDLVEELDDMFNNGATLGEIKDFADKMNPNGVSMFLQDNLINANKDNCFIIKFWQGSPLPSYKITRLEYYITGNGYLIINGWVFGNGNRECYGETLSFDNSLLSNPLPPNMFEERY